MVVLSRSRAASAALVLVASLLAACQALLGLDDPAVVPEETPEAGPEAGGRDSASPDAGALPEGGHCTQVRGTCDLVLQDCPEGQECVVVGATSFKTECVPVQASQRRGKGEACCGGNDNPCRPGLSCIGPQCNETAGLEVGRCGAFCCDGDDVSCGASRDGIEGKCDVLLVTGANTLGKVCSYRKACRPFGLVACPMLQACLLDEGDAGYAAQGHCLSHSGKADHERCSFANDCADGLICAGGAATAVCRTTCLVPETITPFDATQIDGGPGVGGCPDGQACRITFQGLPAWYGACSYADGG